MPPVLALKGAAIRFEKPLFAGLDVGIARGERAALVGRNGSGKSTLLKLLAGLMEPDAGERFVQPGTRVAYLPQEAVRGAETVGEHVRGGLADARATHKADAMLSKLDLDGARDLASLSGGEARRAGLARALSGDPDVLLLDEPTNHLDLPTIEWLERTLAAFPGGVLTISHDRAFLTRIANRVLWLDRGRMRVLDESYARFEDWQGQVLEEEAQLQQKLQRTIESETEWLHTSVRARRTRNEGRKRRLEALREARATWVGPQGRVHLAAASDDSRSRLVIEAEAISLALPDGRALVRDFSMRIMRGDRIGIVGPNGAGKTTLVRALTGQLAPDAGSVRIAKTVTAAYFDQTRESLDPAKTLLATLVPEGGDHVFVQGRPRHAVAYLRDFLFDEKQARTLVGALSGGERNRLLLARTLARRSNLLVLDEPTNDLDLDTLDLLTDTLDGYDGTLIVVSHDRDFLDRLVNGLLVFSGSGRVEEIAGGYSDWLARSPAAPEEKAARPRAPAPPRPAAERARLSWNEARELEALPGRIAALEREREALHARLADGGFYARDPAGFVAAGERLRAAEAELAAAEERWLALEERREALDRARRERTGP